MMIASNLYTDTMMPLLFVNPQMILYPYILSIADVHLYIEIDIFIPFANEHIKIISSRNKRHHLDLSVYVT